METSKLEMLFEINKEDEKRIMSFLRFVKPLGYFYAEMLQQYAERKEYMFYPYVSAFEAGKKLVSACQLKPKSKAKPCTFVCTHMPGKDNVYKAILEELMVRNNIKQKDIADMILAAPYADFDKDKFLAYEKLRLEALEKRMQQSLILRDKEPVIFGRLIPPDMFSLGKSEDRLAVLWIPLEITRDIKDIKISGYA